MRESRRIGMLAPSILVALLAACGGDSQPPTGSGNDVGDGEVGSIQVTTEPLSSRVDAVQVPPN